MRAVRPGQPDRVSPQTAALIVLTLSWAGCSTAIPGSLLAESAGRVYYVDGAGGGSTLVNWGRDVLEGLQRAGLPAEFDHFAWQTGLGAGADQAAGVAYKHEKGRELARQIMSVRAGHPEQPIHLVGFSCGTVIALYALEELPEDAEVDTVVLLASSVSADYDLTRALKRVHGQMHVFTSPRDAVLNVLVPITGTADRKNGHSAVAGVQGFRRPSSSNDETTSEYEKIVVRPWTSELEQLGNQGGHSDFVRPTFVQAAVAPLLSSVPYGLLARANDRAPFEVPETAGSAPQ